jgi:hypothetical protein
VHGHSLPAWLTGAHTVSITLAGARNADRDGDGVRDNRDRCADTAGSAALRGCPAPTHLEAEDAINTGGVKTNDNHTGYAGRAFVDGLWAQGAASAYTLHRTTAAPGRQTITLRYANANSDARTMTLSVNGRKVRQVTFPKVSDSWDSWGTVAVPAVPVTGTDPVVTVSYEPGDSGSINLDWLQFRSAG